jgi:hypothetical protein
MTGLHLEIDLEVSSPDRDITGRVLTGEGAEQRFSGWLQLLTILNATVDEAPTP